MEKDYWPYFGAVGILVGGNGGEGDVGKFYRYQIAQSLAEI